MLKVAIFTEGQSELIFMRDFILKNFNLEQISFLCLELRKGRIKEIPYPYSAPNPILHFQIVNVGNDAKVLSYILEAINNLTSNGFTKILGIRDLYSEHYNDLSGGKISPNITNQFISEHEQNRLSAGENADRITIIFAIMEFEAWLLSMPKLFEKINPLLTTEYIEEKLSYNLEEIFPETIFYHPANDVKAIFELAGLNYNKSRDNSELIVANIDASDYADALRENACPSFQQFHTYITNIQN